MGRIAIAWALASTLVLPARLGAQDEPAPRDAPVPEAPVPSESDLRRVQVEHDGEIRFCLTRERSLTPHARGVVVIETGLDAAGHAVAASVVSSSFAPSGVIAGCLLGALGRWTFPAPRDPAARFALTFELGMEPEPLEPLVPSAPPARAPAPRVTWYVDAAWMGSEGAAVEVMRGMERRRAELELCFVQAALRDGMPSDAVFEIDAYHPGRLRRDDMRLVSATWAHPDPALRCVWREIERVDVREMSGHSRVRWWITVRP